jgi:hypothetical protein
MTLDVLPNGNLRFSIGPNDDLEDLQAMRGDRWSGLLDGYFGIGWSYVAPEWIGALTSAPIVTDDLTFSDAGAPTVRGRIWWFPNYQVEDPVETLLARGHVDFTLAGEGVS